jgi:hypothetical protein
MAKIYCRRGEKHDTKHTLFFYALHKQLAFIALSSDNKSKIEEKKKRKGKFPIRTTK